MFVIGTAGHVDHGKSTLIRALTGIDPDRLREEKERAMTIDLGFAWLRLPSGREVSIVDVPGHERFIKNMLAGVGGIDVALLVIAADEGMMPQTDEHLAILDLLQVSRGVVVLNKSDLADAEWLDLVEEDVRKRLAGTSLAAAPIVRVSAVTGQGLPDLLAAVDALLAGALPRRDVGKPRLPVDRAFTVAGFGTVVTGTLMDGKLSLGQEVDIVPAAREGKPMRSRIRGLQTHKQKEDTAEPGTRVAANLATVAVEDIRRGDVVTLPGWLAPTTLVDVRLRLLARLPRPLPHHAAVTVHTGAAEAEAHVSLLEGDELAPGATAWAQLRLAAPLPVVRGDFFIIRSPNTTLGGGKIVDAHSRRHKRMAAAVLAALATLERGAPAELVLQAMGVAPPLEVAAVAEQAGLPLPTLLPVLAELVAGGELLVVAGARGSAEGLAPRALVVSQAGWQELRNRVQRTLAAYHQQFSLRRGMPQEELKSRLGLTARAFTAAMEKLAAEEALSVEGATVRLTEHQPRLTPEQQAAVERVMARLSVAPYTPPSRAELEGDLGAEVVAALLEQGALVKVSEDVLFSGAAYKALVAGVRERIQSAGRTNVADVRDLFNTTRKYAIALLEHLDQQRVTRREGDDRVLWR